MDIVTIQSELKIGQVHPERLAQMKDYLAAVSSSLMDEQDELINRYSDWFDIHRTNYKSDKGADIGWDRTEDGKRQRHLETVQRKIKTLREAISSHLRVSDNQARNLY